MTHGRRWTDQQWLAQLILYVEWWLGGLRLAVLLNVGLVVGAVGSAVLAARLLGGSARAVLYVTVPCVFAAPWAWQVRPQTFALPLFVWTLFLLTRDVRRPRRSTYVVFPLLVLWANLHGSVVLGAALTALAGVANAVRDRHVTARSAAFIFLPWACVLTSPYAPHLAAYYRLMLVDAPLARYVVEWQASRPGGTTAVFYAVAVGTFVTVSTRRTQLTGYELAVLGLLLVEAILALRGIVWFVLAVQVLLPRVISKRAGPTEPSRRRLDAALATGALVVLTVAVVVIAMKSDSWFERDWPTRAAAVVGRDPSSTTLFASDRLADWLLWRDPSLRGRIAYDVRFELLHRSQLDALVDFSKMRGQRWARASAGYDVVVLDLRKRRARLTYLRSRPRAAVEYVEPGEVAVIRLREGEHAR
jgi:hypothetical protein